MTTLNRAITTLFDILTWPLSWMPPLAALVVLSVLVGILFLLVFPHVSNQKAIKRTKDAIKARLLEIRLFKDDLMLVLHSTGRILLSNGIYLLHNLRAMVILLVPFCLILFQLNARYAYGSLKVGDHTLLSVRFKPGTPLQDVRLELPAGVVAETPPFHSPSQSQVDWRLRAEQPGDYTLVVWAGQEKLEKRLAVESQPSSMAPVRTASLLEGLLYCAEPLIPSQSAFEEVKFQYHDRHLGLFKGGELAVALIFMLVSLAAGFALKGVFGVQL
jgi:hypothetical protein